VRWPTGRLRPPHLQSPRPCSPSAADPRPERASLRAERCLRQVPRRTVPRVVGAPPARIVAPISLSGRLKHLYRSAVPLQQLHRSSQYSGTQHAISCRGSVQLASRHGKHQPLTVAAAERTNQRRLSVFIRRIPSYRSTTSGRPGSESEHSERSWSWRRVFDIVARVVYCS